MAAPICIKSLLLRGIKDACDEIYCIKSTAINPVTIPREEETALRPFLCIFDEPEKPDSKNRYKQAEFVLWLECWITVDKAGEQSEALDEIHAQLQVALLNNNPLLKPYCIYIEELSEDKMYPNETEGVLVNKYTVRYRHVAGNPYLLNPTN